MAGSGKDRAGRNILPIVVVTARELLFHRNPQKTPNRLRIEFLYRTYPGEFNAKWVWAVVVDAMGFVMCFWGVSGLFMWWQIKATRKPGLAVLALSGVAATVLGVAMYGMLS